jgi:hypothetical protein
MSPNPFAKPWTIERVVTTFKLASGGVTWFVNYDHDSKTWAVWGGDMQLIANDKIIKECKGREAVNYTRAKFVLKAKLNHGKKYKIRFKA